jgi:hypothetical protein
MKHFQPLRIQTDFFQQHLGVLHPFLGPQISLQEMTVSDFSAADQDGISPFFKNFQDMLNVNFSGTKIFDNPHIPGVLDSHRTGHIRCRISAVGTDQGNNFGFE